MMYKAILLDLDGTLLDTLTGIAVTCNEILGELNLPRHPQAAYRSFVGDGLPALVERMTPEGTDRRIRDACCARFRELYAHRWRESCVPYPGIVEMLEGLRERGLSLAVLSNKPHDFTTLIVGEMFARNTFSRVCGQREKVPKKPDPQAALAIAAELGAPPAAMAMVGDSGVDIRTAKAAGMLAVGVTWGFRDRAELVFHHADLLIDRPMELLHHVVPAA